MSSKKSTNKSNQPLTINDMEQIFAKFFSPEKLINGVDLVTAPPVAIKKITLKKVVNGKKFACSVCDRKYQSENGFKSHLDRTKKTSKACNTWKAGV